MAQEEKAPGQLPLTDYSNKSAKTPLMWGVLADFYGISIDEANQSSILIAGIPS